MAIILHILIGIFCFSFSAWRRIAGAYNEDVRRPARLVVALRWGMEKGKFVAGKGWREVSDETGG